MEREDRDDDAEHNRLLENERHQIEVIRQLDDEDLQVEIVDGADDLSTDDEEVWRHSESFMQELSGSDPSEAFTFNTSLASMHTYLGEVDDTHRRVTYLDGGTILNLPMIHLPGIVLFPEAILPLRLLQPVFKAALERAINQTDACYIFGVVVVCRKPNGAVSFGDIGTTAEIRQYKYSDDGSLNVVARGQQRFRLQRFWADVEGVLCGEVQIIEEDHPSRTPRDAFDQLICTNSLGHHHASSSVVLKASSTSQIHYVNDENDCENMSETSLQSDDLSLKDSRIYSPTSGSPKLYASLDDYASSEEEYGFAYKGMGQRVPPKNPGRMRLYTDDEFGTSTENTSFLSPKKSTRRKALEDIDMIETHCCPPRSRGTFKAPLSFWPRWVYELYDSYILARRAADLWKRIVGAPRMDNFINKPDVLSFYIASRLPLSQSTRQELLEINGVSYRLLREIQLLESFNLIRCKSCQAIIGKRSDMLVMSSDGPLNAYVNPGGYVHEIMTLRNATGLALIGSPVKEHSWFPGYAWTITQCAMCEHNMGWLFTATEKKLRPKSFWGIRSCQVADDSRPSQS